MEDERTSGSYDGFSRAALFGVWGQGPIMTGAKAQESEESTINSLKVRRPRVIEKALDYIDRHFAADLTLAQVASVNGMSKFHFSRIFKAKTGYTFKEYLNRRRIFESKRLMRDEEMNVSEACFAVGFNDLSYFSRVFNKIAKVTPSEYRKNSMSRPPVDYFAEE
ncbi:MAG: AraC family transcriptional regulator [Thermodesulfobacteriota bacterium]